MDTYKIMDEIENRIEKEKIKEEYELLSELEPKEETPETTVNDWIQSNKKGESH